MVLEKTLPWGRYGYVLVTLCVDSCSNNTIDMLLTSKVYKILPFPKQQNQPKSNKNSTIECINISAKSIMDHIWLYHLMHFFLPSQWPKNPAKINVFCYVLLMYKS